MGDLDELLELRVSVGAWRVFVPCDLFEGGAIGGVFVGDVARHSVTEDGASESSASSHTSIIA